MGPRPLYCASARFSKSPIPFDAVAGLGQLLTVVTVTRPEVPNERQGAPIREP
jgi:hypothetical protein